MSDSYLKDVMNDPRIDSHFYNNIIAVPSIYSPKTSREYLVIKDKDWLGTICKTSDDKYWFASSNTNTRRSAKLTTYPSIMKLLEAL